MSAILDHAMYVLDGLAFESRARDRDNERSFCWFSRSVQGNAWIALQIGCNCFLQHSVQLIIHLLRSLAEGPSGSLLQMEVRRAECACDIERHL